MLQAAAFLVFANACSQLVSLSSLSFLQTDLGIIISPRTEISSLSASLDGMFFIVFTLLVISSHTNPSPRVIAW
ncbi:MAG: hypothetical protein WCG25_06705 [bacterium]